jgi:hypothetical protein
MPTCCFCGCFPRKFVVAHSTLRRHFWSWWKEVRLFCMSPAHRVLLVLGALALCSILRRLRTPFVYRRKSTWGTLGRILRMNPTRRTPNRTLVFTRCTGTGQGRAWNAYRRWRTGRTGRTRVCSVWNKTMNTKERCDCRREIQIRTVRLDDYVNQTFDECSHCLIRCTTFLYLYPDHDMNFSNGHFAMNKSLRDLEKFMS